MGMSSSLPSHSTRPSISSRTVLVGLHANTESNNSSFLHGSTRSLLFFGPWSLPECLYRYLNHEGAFKIPRSLETAVELTKRPVNIGVPPHAALPPVSVATSLFQLFSRSANVFFPVLEPAALDRILSQTYEDASREYFDSTREIFYLVLAIAALVGKRNEHSLTAQAPSWFREATSHINTRCDHASLLGNIMLLQKTLLICVFLPLNPASGDLWRHLGYAIRHFFDLSHRSLMEEEEYRDLICMLTRTLYTLERYVQGSGRYSCD